MAGYVEVQREIAVDADTLYAMVSDVTRMGEWSPETTSCHWRGDADHAEVGARFWGVNKNRWHWWATHCRVTVADPGSRFAFDVDLVLPIANWAFTFEPVDGGTRVTQAWTDRRNGFYRRFGKLADGVRDREPHNTQGMRETLERLAAVAEA